MMKKIEVNAKLRADEVRKELGLSNSEPIEIFKMLRDSLGISLIMRPMDNDVSGMFIRYESAQVIIINTARSLGHQKFTAAHELYHIRYNTGMEGRACKTGLFSQDVENEREADLFAANLLMPDSGIQNWLLRNVGERNRLTLDDIIDLEQYYSVSHMAMLIRLKQLGKIRQSELDKFKPDILINALTRGREPELYKANYLDRVFSPYAQKARTALEERLISEGKYEELLLEGGFVDILYGNEEGARDEDI